MQNVSICGSRKGSSQELGSGKNRKRRGEEEKATKRQWGKLSEKLSVAENSRSRKKRPREDIEKGKKK